MSDPRFPTGRFEPKRRPLTEPEREALLRAIEDHPAALRAAVAGLSDEQLDTPYRDGGWTVRQVVHHVADSHMNSYVRFKLALTEDNPRIRPYEQAAWAESHEARTAPVEVSLELLEALHRRWSLFLRSLEPADFACTLDHPEIGQITVDFLVELYGWHGPHHAAHVTGLRERMGW